MALYHFDVNECGAITIDEEGHECATWDQVLAHAVTVARGIMAAEVMIGKLCLSCCVEIYDADRALLHTMPFTYAIHVTEAISPDSDSPPEFRQPDPSG